MIDTIAIILSKDKFQISKPDEFEPSARWAMSENHKRSGKIISKQNPTKKELLNGIYKPRLSLSNRFTDHATKEPLLKIELSLPKLLYGNNFNELALKDFSAITTKLATILESMGVITIAEILAQAPVAAIHYSKNISLTDGSTPYHFMTKIKQANIKLSLDTNQTDYRNEGHSFRWHCNSYEVVFYDKIKDLEQAKKSSKRALEKDSDLQLDIFDKLASRKKLEILRMEVRLNKKQKIKHLFTKLGIKADLTFKKLFKPAIAKKILLHYLDELESRRPALLDYKPTSDKELLATLIVHNPNSSPQRILQLYGMKLALSTSSLRELRVMFSNHNERSWYRLMTDIKKINLPVVQDHFGMIRNQLSKFKALKIAAIRK